MNPSIFREYDIRGIAGQDMTEDGVEQLGKGIGTFLRRYDAFSYAHDAARRFARLAAESITDLPPSVTRRTLLELTEFVVSRSR